MSAGQRALPPGPATVDEAWQAALWRRLAAHLSPAPDVERLLNPLGPLGPLLPPGTVLPATTGLPAAHVFCLATIAPVHLALLQQLDRCSWAMRCHQPPLTRWSRLWTACCPPALPRARRHTAITRARERVWLAAGAPVVAAAITANTRRSSGLQARLREALAPPAR